MQGRIDSSVGSAPCLSGGIKPRPIQCIGQRLTMRAEGNVFRNVIGFEETGIVSIVAGSYDALTGLLCVIDDKHHRIARIVIARVDTQQPTNPHREPCLLGDLAGGAFGGRFIVFDKPGGQCPVAAPRRDGAADK